MTTEAETLPQIKQAYEQAKRYGEELVKLYAQEKARRKELETTTRKLQAIFDTAPNALAVINADMEIEEANPRFLLMFEQIEQCVGKPLAQFLPVEKLVAIIDSNEIEASGLGGIELEIDKPFTRTLLVALSPLGDNQGWVLILHDLTERKRIEGLKDEFVNIAAHELRTPLAGVMGFVSLLHDELKQIGEPKIAMLANFVLESTQRLKLIIDELVGTAATQHGTLNTLHIANINLTEIIENAVDFLENQIEEKELRYRLELPEKPLIVQGDQFILNEVMYQLLKNAITFTPAGGLITVRARRITPAKLAQLGLNLESLEPDQRATLVEVEDTGVGIPQIDLEKIFDKFYQVQEHLTRGVSGLGLGLTIARHGLERHGGQIVASSKLGQGSIFRVVLPHIVQLNEVSIDTRLDVAHQQMLNYAKDMAQAIAAERRISSKMEEAASLNAALIENLHQLSGVSLAEQDLLASARGLAEQIQQLTKIKPLTE